MTLAFNHQRRSAEGLRGRRCILAERDEVYLLAAVDLFYETSRRLKLMLNVSSSSSNNV